MQTGRARRFGRWVAGVVLLIVLLGGAFWAGRVTLAGPASTGPTESTAVLTEVTQQTVGKVLRYNATVTRKRVPVASNALGGVVTSVSKAGSFKVGSVVYAVDAIPVRVVVGKLPFYRDLSMGAKGEDVAQLRTALADLGYLSNGGGSGFDRATSTAVKAWQKKLGTAQTGWVRKGEIVAVAKLPAVLTFETKVLRKAAVVVGGEPVVFTNSGAPGFALELGDSEAKQVSMDATVTVTNDDVRWPARITGSEPLPDGTTRFTLEASDGGVVCAHECDKLPPGTTNYLLTEISVVSPVSGPGIPIAAVTTQPDGTTTVMVVGPGEQLSQRIVTVKGSQDGVAVVVGVQIGERVQVLGISPEPKPSTPSPEGTAQR